MSDRAAMLREIDKLEAVQQALAAIAARTDLKRRKELIDLRRQLSAQIAATGQITRSVFEAADTEVFQAYREKFSVMCSATALHQASWPAVLMNDDPAAYAASARTAREANRAFIAWVRVAVKTL